MKANIGSALMTEIGLYHYLNLAASIPRLDYPLEEPGIYSMYGYGITREPIEPVNGKIKLRNLNVSDLNFNMITKFSLGHLSKEVLLPLLGRIYRCIERII